MNYAIIIIPIVVLVIVIVCVVVMATRKYDYVLTIVMGAPLTESEPNKTPLIEKATLSQHMTLTKSAAKNLHKSLQEAGYDAELNNNEHTIYFRISFKSPSDSYIGVNDLVDTLTELGITVMDYKGTLLASNITKSGQYTAINGVLEVQQLPLATLYTTEYTNHKTVSASDYLPKTSTSDEAPDENKNMKSPDSDETDDFDDMSDQDGTDTPDESEPSQTPDTKSTQEEQYHGFIKQSSEPLKMELKFVCGDSIKIIQYPVYAASVFDEIDEYVESVLEPYKGYISHKERISTGKTIELHYQNTTGFEKDYTTIETKLKEGLHCLTLHINDASYTYQTTDTARFKRYMSKLKEMNVLTQSVDEFDTHDATIDDVNVIDHIVS